jgi:hypothetical protein
MRKRSLFPDAYGLKGRKWHISLKIKRKIKKKKRHFIS